MFPYPSSSPFHFPFLHNGGVCTSKSNVCFFRVVSKRIELDVPAFVAHSRLPNISLIGPGNHDLCANMLHRK